MRDIRTRHIKSHTDMSLRDRVEEFERRTLSVNRGGLNEDSFQDDAFSNSRPDDEYEENYRRAIYNEKIEKFKPRDFRDRSDISHNYSGENSNGGNKSGQFKILFYISILLVIVLCVALLTYVFNKATVTITPIEKSFYLDQKVILGTGLDTLSVKHEVSTSTLSLTKELKVEGTTKKISKATGNIIVFNNDKEAVKLVKNTRFESADGKIYRINKAITIPAKKDDIPGQIKTEVTADAPGKEYNTLFADFTVPGLKGSPKFSSVFARSDGQITGGTTGESLIINQIELNQAKDEIALSLKRKVDELIKGSKVENSIIIPGTTKFNISDNSLAVLGGETSTYVATMTASVFHLDKESLVNYVLANKADFASVKASYLENSSLSGVIMDNGTSTGVALNVAGDFSFKYIVDENDVKKSLVGINRSAWQNALAENTSIGRVKVTFSPLWLSKFPLAESKIDVIVE